MTHLPIVIIEGNEAINKFLEQFKLDKTVTLPIVAAVVKEKATSSGYPSIILVVQLADGSYISCETTARLLKGVTSAATGAANRVGLFDI